MVICLTGDDRVPTSTSVKASAAAILARILVTNTNFLAQLASEQSLSMLLQNAGFSVGENILFCLVDVWLDKVSLTSNNICIILQYPFHSCRELVTMYLCIITHSRLNRNHF